MREAVSQGNQVAIHEPTLGLLARNRYRRHITPPPNPEWRSDNHTLLKVHYSYHSQSRNPRRRERYDKDAPISY